MNIFSQNMSIQSTIKFYRSAFCLSILSIDNTNVILEKNNMNNFSQKFYNTSIQSTGGNNHLGLSKLVAFI